MTERRFVPPRLPAHVALMLGASAAGYAVVLAGVAGLQSSAEAAVAAARAPALRAVELAGAGHTPLAEQLDRAGADYQAAADAYRAAGSTLDGLHADLGGLAAVVGKIQGASRSLPATIRLPAIRVVAPAAQPPTTHTTTRASGG